MPPWQFNGNGSYITNKLCVQYLPVGNCYGHLPSVRWPVGPRGPMCSLWWSSSVCPSNGSNPFIYPLKQEMFTHCTMTLVCKCLVTKDCGMEAVCA